MEPFFTDCLDILGRLYKDMEAVLEGLPVEALDWRPGAETNSLAVLAVHTAASQRYWIGDVIAGEASGRDRDSEFVTAGLDGEALKAGLQGSLAYCRQALERLSLADLKEKRISPSNGRKVTAGWALAHTLEHTAQHVGHMQLTRQIWQTLKTGKN